MHGLVQALMASEGEIHPMRLSSSKRNSAVLSWGSVVPGNNPLMTTIRANCDLRLFLISPRIRCCSAQALRSALREPLGPPLRSLEGACVWPIVSATAFRGSAGLRPGPTRECLPWAPAFVRGVATMDAAWPPVWGPRRTMSHRRSRFSEQLSPCPREGSVACRSVR
jgi:hypothetical protein